MFFTKVVCDQCNAVLSDVSEKKRIAKEHISLSVKEMGWAKYSNGKWAVKYGYQKQTFQFCNPSCLADFFAELKAKKFLLTEQ